MVATMAPNQGVAADVDGTGNNHLSQTWGKDVPTIWPFHTTDFYWSLQYD